MSYRIAVDIGGTFTDGVIEQTDTGVVRVAKRLTTTGDPGLAVSRVIDDLLEAVGGRIRCRTWSTVARWLPTP